MPRINKRQRYGLYSLAIMVLITGYVYLIYLPKEKEFSALEITRGDKEIQLRKASIQARNQKRLKIEIKSLEDKLTNVRMQLPKEKEIPDLLKSIDAKGRQSNIDFLYFKPQPIITKEFYGEVPINLTVKGGFHNLGIFLNKIAGLSRLINMSGIKISSISGKDEKVTIQATMVAKSYVYMENIPVPVTVK